MYDACILELTSSSNQFSLAAKKRGAQGMVPPTRVGKALKSPQCPPFHFCCCYVSTQLALQLHQERTQVVCSNIEAGGARSEGTPAMGLGLEGIRAHRLPLRLVAPQRRGPRGLPLPRIFLVLGGMKVAFVLSSSPGPWCAWCVYSADVDSRVWLASTWTYIACTAPFMVWTHSRLGGRVPGLLITDCARGFNNRGNTRPQVSTTDVKEKTFFERIYLVPGLRKFVPWVNCPYKPTTPTIHCTTIFRFLRNFFPEWPINFFWSARCTK